MRRRSALQFGGATLAGLLAGCSVFEGSDSGLVTVEVITIRNRLDREIEISVLLVEDERVAYWQSVSVPAGSNPFAVLDDVPSEAGAYELYAHVPAVDDDPPVNANLVDDAGDQSCIRVGMEVSTARVDGKEVPAVVYGTIGECRESE
jgi:hypothetical protein